MVIVRCLIVAFLIMLPVRLYAVSADDLRSLSSDNERERQNRQGRAKTSDLSPLVGVGKDSVDKAGKNGKIENKRFSKKKKTVGATPVKSAKIEPSTESDKSPEEQAQVEMPLPPVPGQQTIVSDAIKPSNSFGIRLGAWMEGNINRNTSSAEPGLVEITLTSDIIGDRKTLKAGTILFAQKQFNSSTKRLEMMVQKGITPSGQEFTMSGLIFDTQKVSGLSGIVDMDNANSVKRGASKGLIAAAGAAAKGAASATPFGSAASATADSVLQDQTNVVEQTTGQQITIYVSPQPLLIRVDQTF